MTIEQIKAKIEKLEAQVIEAQNDHFGTPTGYHRLQALHHDLGNLERKLYEAQSAKFWEATLQKGIKVTKTQEKLLNFIIVWAGFGRSTVIESKKLKTLQALEAKGLVKVEEKDGKYRATLAEI